MTGMPTTRAELDHMIDERIAESWRAGMKISARKIAEAFERSQLHPIEGRIEAEPSVLGLQRSEREGDPSDRLLEAPLPMLVGTLSEPRLKKTRVGQLRRYLSGKKFRKHSSPSVVDASRVGAAGSGPAPGPDRSS